MTLTDDRAIAAAAMIGDSIFVVLGLYYNAVFTHPFYEGFLILYGTLGTPWIGIMVLVIAFRYRKWTDVDNNSKIGVAAGEQNPR